MVWINFWGVGIAYKLHYYKRESFPLESFVALLQAMPIIIILTLIYDLHNILGEGREAFVVQSY